jgi:hypothetical protein
VGGTLGPLAIIAALGYGANKATPEGDKAPMSSTPYAEGMTLPGGAINFGASDTALLKQRAGWDKLTASVQAGLTVFQDVEGAVEGYDGALAKMVARNPDKAMGRLQRMAEITGVSIEDLTASLPKTARNMDKAGYSADGAKIRTESWKNMIVRLGQETDTVDGKKPKVPFEFPGLPGGIDDIITAGIRTDDVGRKKPSVPWQFPNLLWGIQNVWALDRAADEAARPRTLTITTIRNTMGGVTSTGGGHSAPDVAAPRLPAPTVSTPRMAGTSGGTTQRMTMTRPTSRRLVLAVDGHEFGAYLRDTAAGEASNELDFDDFLEGRP